MNLPRNCQPQRAMTLIEMIGALAVLAILAAVLVPAFVRQMDKVASEQEDASLKSLGDALQQSILRNRSVPSYTNWASVVAGEQGVDVLDVLTNPRHQPRVFLIDPALRIGTNVAGQRYQQNNAGSIITNNGVIVPPISPRVILLSSISRALPAGVVSGVPATTNDFNAVWDWNDPGGAPPAGSLWAGWQGARDLKVQRINLAPLFVRLVLTTYASPSNGLYSIDRMATNSVPTSNSIGMEGYFFQNSVLSLITHMQVLDAEQVLIRDSSFVYNESVWRGSIAGGLMIGGFDIAGIVAQFLAAPNNPNAMNPTGNQQQVLVVQAMMNYMDAYEAWAAANFPRTGPNAYLLDNARTAQSAMMTAVWGLYKKISGQDYFPPEVPCL